MIDIHSHILPGVDDGADSLAESVAMLDAAAAIGITRIVATPHLTDRLTGAYADAVAAAFDEVAPLARDRGIELVRGFEVRLATGIAGRLRGGEPIVLGDSAVVLVDLPYGEWPNHVHETLYNIQVSGFLPVLAHPERYPAIQRRPETARELAERGVGMQVTTGSFSGIFGRRAKRTAEAMLRLGAVHIVATDAHSADHRMAAVPPGLKRLEALAGAESLRRLTVDGPAGLLGEGTLPPTAPATPNRGILSALAGRSRR